MEKIIEEDKQGQSLNLEHSKGNNRKLFIESYGCQMNFSDSEIVASILSKEGFNTTQNLEDADLVLVNTCSIRDKAEQTVRKRLEKYNAVKKINPSMKIGVLGCMAERLKEKFLETAPIYQDTQGLLRKNYIVDLDNHRAGGVYCFDTKQNAKNWFDDARIAWITERYSKPNIEFFENPVIVDNDGQQIIESALPSAD